MLDLKTDNRSRRAPQARGIARREQLLAAAIILLEERELDEVSLADVAEKAGIPVTSAYSLYPNINGLFSQLMVTFTHQLADAIEDDISAIACETWMDVIGGVCDGHVKFYESHKACERIRLSGKAPAEIRYNEDRVGGLEFAPRIRTFLERRFILPALEDIDRIFLVMLDLIDGIYVSAYVRDGYLSDTIAREAKRAALAYLKLYLPEFLPLIHSARVRSGTQEDIDV